MLRIDGTNECSKWQAVLASSMSEEDGTDELKASLRCMDESVSQQHLAVCFDRYWLPNRRVGANVFRRQCQCYCLCFLVHATTARDAGWEAQEHRVS